MLTGPRAINRAARYVEATAGMLHLSKQLQRIASQITSIMASKSPLRGYHGVVVSSAHDVDVWLTPSFPVEAARLSKAYKATFAPPMPCYLALEDEWLQQSDPGWHCMCPVSTA